MARFIGIVTFGLVVVLFLQCTAAQTVYVVGDDMGWDVPSGGAQAYVNWANGKNFRVGDNLTFVFATNSHDVVRVPKGSFDACTSSNSIGDVITQGPANLTLESAGEHYYICTIGRHCLNGQKLAITVSSSGSTGGATPPSTTPAGPAPPSSNGPSSECSPTPAPGPKGTTDVPTPAGSSGPASSTPGSSSSNVLASFMVSTFAIIIGLVF